METKDNESRKESVTNQKTIQGHSSNQTASKETVNDLNKAE